ncbi:uncharacterized protein N7479_000035 [Penicillium vulpinum]|uniref:DUF7702 domain-containing protein n=1 Tax=Penicillium vulpinum TaxID=29845 RepID=A0A1V6RX72_9EURO|nr:uncharacterized protein N7479_000035 [Penicillium vulpinum]KAJ5970117.1 hypothetical protein N7479_000035 [Penicillium vulpinum]OQE06246.1 hypothetical protein PENVUL_c019G00887 [Penicillium vulpinum]
MAVVTTEHVAIAELIIYIPTALLSIWVVICHGFHKQLGWVYLSIFSAIRVGGAVMEILSTKNPNNANDKEWALILQSVGLSPLLLSTLGLLKRVFDETSQHVPSSPGSKGNTFLQVFASFGITSRLMKIYSKRATATSIRSKIVQLLHIPALIALVLAISGGIDQTSSNISDHASGKTKTRAAIILFLAIYVATCTLWAMTVQNVRLMESSQNRIFFCVLLALPFIAIRVLYSLISDFGNNHQFSVADGDPRIQLVMATLEEFVVVLMYTILGLITPKSTSNSGMADFLQQEICHTTEYAENLRRHRHADHPPYDEVSYAQAAAQEAYNQQHVRR